SFNKLGRQTGILFYIPAWCTSKIDPVTGFVNLFNTKYENIEKSRGFISKFKDIRYNSDENYFEFVVDDYSKFTDKLKGTKKDWIICSFGDRIWTHRNPNNNNQWDNEKIVLTDEFKQLFSKYGIDINNIQKEIEIKTTLDKEFYTSFFALFKLMVQMRNSVTGEFEDYIISPVKGKDGNFYDSRKCGIDLPKDADANGAYNIARKGLMLVNQLKAADNKKKINYKISNQEWLNFVQNVNI
ncbi:MAG: hypothetical protein LUH05_09325, partial [Candidatus Gastranaerophilales bacterium]|nr:hypothetical protein [Candidatus Gastranaerophilales bacterium]